MKRLKIYPLKLYELTPNEIAILIERQLKQEKETLKIQLATAYYGELFARSKRLPNLEKMLNNIDKPPKSAPSKGDLILKRMAEEKE
ncbi:MAG: hypothetical protein RRZ69_04680 [Clostridia bacterium]